MLGASSALRYVRQKSRFYPFFDPFFGSEYGYTYRQYEYVLITPLLLSQYTKHFLT